MSIKLRIFAIVCFLMAMLALTPARSLAEGQDIGGKVSRHDRQGWSIIIDPIVMSWSHVNIRSSVNYAEHGLAAVLSRSLSLSTSLEAGLVMATGKDVAKRREYCYTVTLGPKFLIPKMQNDRFYVGICGAVMAVNDPRFGARWGIGPQVEFGIDYSVVRRKCLHLEGQFGWATLNGKSVQSQSATLEPAQESGNGIVWGRLLLGMRIYL